MTPTAEQYREAAINLYQDDDLEIDESADVSEVDEPSMPKGAWVKAWVWVSADETSP